MAAEQLWAAAYRALFPFRDPDMPIFTSEQVKRALAELAIHSKSRDHAFVNPMGRGDCAICGRPASEHPRPVSDAARELSWTPLTEGERIRLANLLHDAGHPFAESASRWAAVNDPAGARETLERAEGKA